MLTVRLITIKEKLEEVQLLKLMNALHSFGLGRDLYHHLNTSEVLGVIGKGGYVCILESDIEV